MTVSVQALIVMRGAASVLNNVSASFAPGRIAVLAGPNGAGKSTLLEAVAGDLPAASGRVLYGDQPVACLPLLSRARVRTMLPQRAAIAFDFAVRDVIAMGLHPHGLSPAAAPGVRMIDEALEDMELLAHAGRPATRLSGGEQQRVHIARCLVQVRAALAAGKPALLLLDEPTTGLDYRHQFALAAILRTLAQQGATLIVSLHDLLLARSLADTILLLGDGRLIAMGAPQSILTPAAVAGLYGLDPATAAALLGSSNAGFPHCATPRDAACAVQAPPVLTMGAA